MTREQLEVAKEIMNEIDEIEEFLELSDEKELIISVQLENRRNNKLHDEIALPDCCYQVLEGLSDKIKRAAQLRHEELVDKLDRL